MTMLLRWLVLFHRWAAVTLCLLFCAWFVNLRRSPGIDLLLRANDPTPPRSPLTP